jgi:protein ImuA
MPAPACPTVLKLLRDRIRRLEGLSPATGEVAALGVPEVDAALPWGGLPRGAMHEVVAEDRGAGDGFAAILAARLAGDGEVLWCARREDLYPPGLAPFGLAARRLILARAVVPEAALWVIEESLRSGALGAVVGEVPALSLAASRRLQLAAAAGATPAILLRPAGAAGASAALTRWRVAAAASAPVWPGVGSPRFRVALERCRGGVPNAWLMEWDDATLRCPVAADAADRPARPAAA